ncbi:MAG: hypothetical protein JSS32_04085, partial [Verrucomicrobia bacterium]|nr:hypothetical protein [Verrucomicrobiota bacterium]
MKTKSARRGPYPVHTFCIITAKSDELREVKSVLKTAFRREDDDPLSGRAVYIVKERPRQPTLTLLATTCSAMGNVYAATKTAQIISLHNPSVLFFVGTAASLDPGTVRLGDVIVPNGYGYRFYDKIVEKGQKDFEKAVADKDFKERFFGDNVLLTDYFTHSLPGSAPDLISDVDFKSGVMLDDGDLAQEWQDELKKGSSMRTPKVETDVQM